VVRTRPLNQQEANVSEFETVSVIDDKVIILVDPTYQKHKKDVTRFFLITPQVLRRNREKQYAFDYAFDKTQTQKQIFQKTTKFLIKGVLDGFNATIFAYGATGAGKTYTMMGVQGKPGVMFLTVQNLFNRITAATDKEFAVKISYLEIYNESIRDLLTSDDTNLELRHDPISGVKIAGISEVITSNVTEVFTMLKIGNKNRMKEATNANAVSSRSHAVLRITVHNKNKGDKKGKSGYVGKLSLIDLAGSERAAKTKNKGLRLFEGA
jgi:kinesin family member 18/19